MTRMHISVSVVLLILSTLAATFMPLAPARALSTGWRALTPMLPAFTDISRVAISPNSQYVVFIADIEEDNRYELYSVPITGSVPVKLNPPLVAGGNVKSFLILPDSSGVIYTADQEVDERVELYSVPITGGPAIKLNGPLVSGGNVVDYKVDANIGRAVYEADQQSNDVFALYSVPIGGGAFVRLNPALVQGGSVYSFDIDPVSHRAVYSADQDTNDLYELYSVYIPGGPAVKLNPAVSQSVTDYQIAPGAAYVMFRAKAVGASAYELYGITTGGFFLRKRNYALNPGENVTGFLIGSTGTISPTGTLVVYGVGTNNTFGWGNLYRADPYTGDSQILMGAGPDFGVSVFSFTPDGEHIVCEYQQNAASPLKLISVKTSGFPAAQADLFVPDTGHMVNSYRVSPDSQWVMFEDFDSFGDPTLRAVPTAGGSQVTLGPGALPVITPDSQRVIYSYPLQSDHSDVISVQIFGGGQRNLSRMHRNGYAYDPHPSPDSQWIVFQAELGGGSGPIGYQLRVSDGAEAPLVFYIYLPVVQK